MTTPYTTVAPYFGELAPWVPEEEQDRIAAYLKYDDIYWSEQGAIKLAVIDDDTSPIYVPKAKTIVDTTSHFLLKGLSITAPESNAEMTAALKALFDRELFLSKFHTAKHSGVSRGDFLLHISADPAKAPGSRISINTVHPASWFPVYDEWDPEKLIKVHLAEQFEKRDDGRVKTYLRRLTYEYVTVAGNRRVKRSEGFFEEKDWFDPKKERLVRRLLKTELLPETITTIPVYHFKNIDWQGQDYGSSELRGTERLLQAINQTVTDEEVALALEGLGVYATDAAGPVDANGTRTAWEVAPARVMEVPLGSYFKRVEGVGSVTPMLDHVKYLQESLYEGSGTTEVARGVVEATVAQSGIALAIKFLPSLAKIEQRDYTGMEKLRQFFFDWNRWHAEFEGQNFGEAEVTVSIGDKLPDDKVARLNELNNMFDRQVISAAFFRAEMTRIGGYVFPDDIEDQIAKDAEAKFEMAQKLADLNKQNNEVNEDGAGKSGVAGRPREDRPASTNRSNNSGRPNESGGNEAR